MDGESKLSELRVAVLETNTNVSERSEKLDLRCCQALNSTVARRQLSENENLYSGRMERTRLQRIIEILSDGIAICELMSEV